MSKVNFFFQKSKLTIIGIAIGLIVGFIYWYFVGCTSGTCAIKSKPLNMTLYGGLMGGLLFNMFQKKEINKTN